MGGLVGWVSEADALAAIRGAAAWLYRRESDAAGVKRKRSS
jgi:hypothetical protein